jgi:hypothetical protein
MGQNGSRFDWGTLQPFPRQRRDDAADRDRLARKAKRAHPKRHSENRERSRHLRAVARLAKRTKTEAQERRTAKLIADREYWAAPFTQ